MKKLYLFLAAMLVCLTSNAAVSHDFYICGENINGDKNWGTTTANQLTDKGRDEALGAYVYEWKGTELGTGFKFRNGKTSNWSDGYNLGGSSALTIGEEYTLNNSSTSGNIRLNEATVKNPVVTLRIYSSNIDTPASASKITVTVKGAGGGEIEWFVPGLDDESMSLDDAHKMTKVSDGVYELKNFVITAPGQFAVASTGWTDKFGNLEAGITPSNLSGVLAPAFAETGNVEYTITGTYDIKWVYATKTISFTKSGATEDVTYYIVGAEIGLATNVWDPPYADNQKFTNEGDGIYTISLSHLGNSFKINAGNWTDKTNTFGAGEGDILLNVPYPYTIGDAAGNFKFADDVTSVENATVTLDVNEGTITVEGTPTCAEKEWYLTLFPEGEVFDWANAIKLNKTAENVYTATEVAISGDGSFKISTMNWGEQYGAGNETSPIDGENMEAALVPVSLESAVVYENLNGKYTVTWNYGTKTVKFVQTSSGIDNVDSDATAAPVEYYNIQGIRVANPKGFVIKKQGDKVEKLIIK